MSQQILPVPDSVSEVYWARLAEGRLGVQLCSNCNSYQFPFRLRCRRCGSEESEWSEVDRGAEVYSWVVVNRCIPEELGWPVPYGIAVLALDNGARIYAGLDPADIERVHAGTRVEVDLREMDGVTLPWTRVP